MDASCQKVQLIQGRTLTWQKKPMSAVFFAWGWGFRSAFPVDGQEQFFKRCPRGRRMSVLITGEWSGEWVESFHRQMTPELQSLGGRDLGWILIPWTWSLTVLKDSLCIVSLGMFTHHVCCVCFVTRTTNTRKNTCPFRLGAFPAGRHGVQNTI